LHAARFPDGFETAGKKVLPYYSPRMEFLHGNNMPLLLYFAFNEKNPASFPANFSKNKKGWE